SGEDRENARLAAPRDDLRRTNVLKDWADDQDVGDVELDEDDLDDE
ncbi:phosphosugar isomerase, partial [Deinococcus sp. 14RED07]|nr:phosphosugar isomerase [Deinococcus sp. 14RED07]